MLPFITALAASCSNALLQFSLKDTNRTTSFNHVFGETVVRVNQTEQRTFHECRAASVYGIIELLAMSELGAAIVTRKTGCTVQEDKIRKMLRSDTKNNLMQHAKYGNVPP